MMAGTLHVRRSRGALGGVLLVLLGIWGAVIPFVGPYFHYAYTPDRAWVVTAGRMWLEVLPGAVAVAAGVFVLLSRFRPAAVFCAWLAALAGTWFAVGDLVAAAWTRLPRPGTPVGGASRAALEQIGFFTGLGVVILFVAALTLGRFTVVAARDKARAAASKAKAADATQAGAATGERTAAGTSAGHAASRAASRVTPRVRAIPVFRGRQSSTATKAAAGRAATEADLATAKADAAKR
jgi:hypothetical protein